MAKLFLITLAVLVASSSAFPFGELFPAAQGIIGKSGNLIGIEADAHVKVGDHKVGVDGAAGIGEDGIGGHGAGDANIFGQEAGTHADVLGGYPGEHHGHHDSEGHGHRGSEGHGHHGSEGHGHHGSESHGHHEFDGHDHHSERQVPRIY